MHHPNHLFTPGTLWPALLERTAHARERRAILTIPTEPEVIEQNSVAFQVRVITALAMKALTTAAQSNNDPFLPYDPDLFVADLSQTHVALLNKFNVVDHHLVIVTRSFESQEALLTLEDCAALLICLAEIDGLGFYNAGPAAGASQRHKHLQLIPLSALPEARLPIEPLLRTVQMTGATGTVPSLPFSHAYALMEPAWIDQRRDGASSLLSCYHSLLRSVGLSIEMPSVPYNLLLTRRWLLLVPRSEEYFEGISINALGFAGALLVKNAAQLAILRKHGCRGSREALTPEEKDDASRPGTRCGIGRRGRARSRLHSASPSAHTSASARSPQSTAPPIGSTQGIKS
jgi:sulfate adenylyltransferase (ADP) / ATP adenylyltransferase